MSWGVMSWSWTVGDYSLENVLKIVPLRMIYIPANKSTTVCQNVKFVND